MGAMARRLLETPFSLSRIRFYYQRRLISETPLFYAEASRAFAEFQVQGRRKCAKFRF